VGVGSAGLGDLEPGVHADEAVEAHDAERSSR